MPTDTVKKPQRHTHRPPHGDLADFVSAVTVLSRLSSPNAQMHMREAMAYAKMGREDTSRLHAIQAMDAAVVDARQGHGKAVPPLMKIRDALIRGNYPVAWVESDALWDLFSESGLFDPKQHHGTHLFFQS